MRLGSSPETRSAIVTSSTTERIAERSATQTYWSGSARPSYSSVSGPARAHAGERAFDRAHDVGDGDLLGRLAEPVAAVGRRAGSRPARRGAARRGCSQGTSAGSPGRRRSCRASPARHRPRPAPSRRAPRTRLSPSPASPTHSRPRAHGVGNAGGRNRGVQRDRGRKYRGATLPRCLVFTTNPIKKGEKDHSYETLPLEAPPRRGRERSDGGRAAPRPRSAGRGGRARNRTPAGHRRVRRQLGRLRWRRQRRHDQRRRLLHSAGALQGGRRAGVHQDPRR